MIGNEENGDLVHDMYSQFGEALNRDLYVTIQRKYPHLKKDRFDRFILSYILILFGYLEWMLIDTSGNNPFSVVWDNLWHNVASLIEASAEDHPSAD
jgi:hypothetical protein